MIKSYSSGISIRFYDYITNIIARLILYGEDTTILDIDSDSFHFFEQGNRWLLKADIKRIKEWGEDLGYEVKISYHNKPIFTEESSSDCEISSFRFIPPSIQIEITKKQK